jgi:hypothetical protein
VSRGGTKKARAAQQRQRKTRQRYAATVAKEDKKERKRQERENAPKKGKAAFVHLAGTPAPMVLAIALFLSGQAEPTTDNPDPLGPMWSNPIDLLALAGFMIVIAGVFWLTPVLVWKRVYRDEPLPKWDFSAVDSSFTLLVVVAVAWLLRATFGYTEWIDVTTSVLLTLSLYLPVFSALLALIMPAVPGGFRVGGVLPGPLRIPFTRLFLLTDDQKEEVAAYRTTAKALRSSS